MTDVPNKTPLARQRAHDAAHMIGSLHMAGLDVDPAAFELAQRYVDGEIAVDRVTFATWIRDPVGAKSIDVGALSRD